MTKDTQSRKWQLTINNPVEKGYTHDFIKAILSGMQSVIYWCMADEIGEQGTYHTHVYIQGRGAIRFSTLKRLFVSAHFEVGKGTALQNYEYISKSGKWEADKKHETCVDGTFEQWGEMPVERQGSRNDIADLVSMIEQGLSDYQIIQEMPEAMLKLEDIGKTRQIFISEKSRNEWRDVQSFYVWGDTATGKTRSIMDKYGYSNVFRITDYLHPFDNYHGQDVVVFEEFRSSIGLSNMLNYLDGYPLELPCRYSNKWACFHTVFIVSNVPLSDQYRNHPVESFNAFLRRLKGVIHFLEWGHVYNTIEIHADGFQYILSGEKSPFDN